jgi:hypothetical protein
VAKKKGNSFLDDLASSLSGAADSAGSALGGLKDLGGTVEDALGGVGATVAGLPAVLAKDLGGVGRSVGGVGSTVAAMPRTLGGALEGVGSSLAGVGDSLGGVIGSIEDMFSGGSSKQKQKPPADAAPKPPQFDVNQMQKLLATAEGPGMELLGWIADQLGATAPKGNSPVAKAAATGAGNIAARIRDYVEGQKKLQPTLAILPYLNALPGPQSSAGGITGMTAGAAMPGTIPQTTPGVG